MDFYRSLMSFTLDILLLVIIVSIPIRIAGIMSGEDDTQDNLSLTQPPDSANNGGDADVFSDSAAWKQVPGTKKRKFNSSNSSAIGIEQYKTLSVDDKLAVLFSNSSLHVETMGNIESKIDTCLHMQKDIGAMKCSLNDYETRVTLLEFKSIDLEARSRRKNLIFLGFRECQEENCATKIGKFLSEKLEIESHVQIDRAHRLGRYKRDSHRPIIVAFRDYGDTQLILSRANKLRDTGYSINRDYPQEIVSARKSLWSFYKSLKRENPSQRVSIVYPAKVLMNGKVVRDAFPQWDAIMRGSRIQQSSNVNTPGSNARVTRADSGQQPSRSRSRDSNSSTSPKTVESPSLLRRRNSRSHTRRGSAHAPIRSDSVCDAPRGMLTNRDRSFSRGRDDTGHVISRPWDSSAARANTSTY